VVENSAVLAGASDCRGSFDVPKPAWGSVDKHG
jgi:hypothetical protein